MADLDDLLDDIEIEQEEGKLLENAWQLPSYFPPINCPLFYFLFSIACEASGTVSKTPLQYEWTKSVENIHEDVSNRWSSYMIKDMNTMSK